jgi:predicted pyridoxine 5'-phosphate oxidase superfamily flavin-nucleotide-binding protein
MITKKIGELLKAREFVSVATCDFQGNPNVAPKFILKLENNFIYLIDYVIGRSYEHLKENPRVSLSIMNLDNLTGYQVNGSAELIKEGKDHEQLLKETVEKEISLSTKRIIEGVGRGEKHSSFELSLSAKVVIYKVKIEEVVEIGPSGELKREKIWEN